MKYIVIVENGDKPVLVVSKANLNCVVANTPEGLGIICTAWNNNTPASIMAMISERILRKEKSMLVGLHCAVAGLPLDEVLWEEFEKALS